MTTALLQWTRNSPPCHELTARRRADRLNVIIFQFDSLCCELVQHRSVDIWTMVANVSVPLVVHHNKDEVRRSGPCRIHRANTFICRHSLTASSRERGHSNHQHHWEDSSNHPGPLKSISTKVWFSQNDLLHLQPLNLQLDLVCWSIVQHSYLSSSLSGAYDLVLAAVVGGEKCCFKNGQNFDKDVCVWEWGSRRRRGASPFAVTCNIPLYFQAPHTIARKTWAHTQV